MAAVLDTPLRAARKAAGLTQFELAARAGVSPQTLWRAETGWSQVSDDTQDAIASALGIPAGELFVHEPNGTDHPAAREENRTPGAAAVGGRPRGPRAGV